MSIWGKKKDEKQIPAKKLPYLTVRLDLDDQGNLHIAYFWKKPGEQAALVTADLLHKLNEGLLGAAFVQRLEQVGKENPEYKGFIDYVKDQWILLLGLNDRPLVEPKNALKHPYGILGPESVIPQEPDNA